MTTPLDEELPEPTTFPFTWHEGPRRGYTANQVRAILEADRAARQPAPPQQPQDDLAAASLAAPAAQAQQRSLDAVDAARYRWLRERLLAADFAWGDPPTPVIVFEWPANASIGADLDASVDAAMPQPPQGGSGSEEA